MPKNAMGVKVWFQKGSWWMTRTGRSFSPSRTNMRLLPATTTTGWWCTLVVPEGASPEGLRHSANSDVTLDARER
jgi:hypothetical protein